MADKPLNETKVNAHLNKIYRALHDGVCPRCGELVIHGQGVYECLSCHLVVTDEEQHAMGKCVAEWGVELMKTFEAWRESRRSTGEL